MNCNTPGGGQIAKTCNNMALAIQMVSVAEALAMAEKLGLDPNIMASIMLNASSRCWSIDTYSPLPGVLNKKLPCDSDFDGGFQNELLVKDLTIAINSAKKCGAKIDAGQLALKLFTEMKEEGLAKKDIGIIYKKLKNL